MHFEWHIVPTGAHSYIGSVKRQVGMVKRVLNRKLSGAVVNNNLQMQYRVRSLQGFHKFSFFVYYSSVSRNTLYILQKNMINKKQKKILFLKSFLETLALKTYVDIYLKLIFFLDLV